jgi:hypothetical protein
MSPIGLRVGPFEIVEDAVVPAHGSWYRARRAGMSRRDPASVLVRLLGPSPSSRELGEMQRQFEALRAIDDPRVPSAVALYEGSGALAVAAPIAAPLSRVVQARLLDDVEMTPATLIDLALEVTEALQAAHQRGHHHGHLSADNVAVSVDGGVWVWGFGAPEARPPFAWLPPERARGDRATPATDQWSLGALIVALVSGQTPWSASSAAADPRSGDLGDYVEAVATQWPALGRLVRRMLDADPAQRFPSLHPVRLELLALGRRAGGASERRELAAWLHHTWRMEMGVADPSVPIAAHAGPAIGPLSVDVALDDEPALGVEIDAPVTVAVHSPSTTARIAPPSVEPHRGGSAPLTAARIAPASFDLGDLGPTPGPRAQRDAATVAPPPAAAVAVARPAVASLSLPPPGRAAASTLPLPPLAPADVADHPTEMAEDWIPTEMAGPVDLDAEAETPPAPPVRRAVSAQAPTDRSAPTRVAAPTLTPTPIQLTDEQPAGLPPADEPAPLRTAALPLWREEPAPTMPGMEAPEPVRLTVAPRLAVEIEFEEPLAVEAEIDDIDDIDDVDDIRFISEDDDALLGPASDAGSAPLDDDDLGDALWTRAAPPTSIQPFTDPHFGPLDAPETAPPAFARRLAPGFDNDDEDDAGPVRLGERPSLDLDGPSLAIASTFPWEREPALDLPQPANEPVVRFAPWLATAAMAGLVLLTVLNVVRAW